MVLEYLPTFTLKSPSFVGKYTSTIEHLAMPHDESRQIEPTKSLLFLSRRLLVTFSVDFELESTTSLGSGGAKCFAAKKKNRGAPKKLGIQSLI